MYSIFTFRRNCRNLPDNMKFYVVLTTVFCGRILLMVSAALPPPVSCNSDGCTFSNYQGTWIDRTACRAAKVLYPTNERELVEAVAEAARNDLKVKVVSESSHTMNKLGCPGGNTGLLVSTRDYDSYLLVNESALTVNVDAGVQLRNFVAEVAKYGLTIPHTPNWDGVSMAGVISTGSHGSGLWLKGSSISEYIVGVRMVIPAAPEEGYAKVIELQEADEDMKAVRISLGVLGVISKVTFSLMPMFKRSVTMELATDDNLEDQVEMIARSHNFPLVSWTPSAHKVIYRKEDLVSVDVEGDGVNNFPLTLPMTVSMAENMRAYQESFEMSRDVESLCHAGEKMLSHRIATAEGLQNDETSFKQFPVIGFNHRMQTFGGCQVVRSEEHPYVAATGIESVVGLTEDSLTCKWDPRIRGFFYHHTAVAIPLFKVKDFILDVKKLRELNPTGMCSLNTFGGIMVRFVSKSEAYLGVEEDAAVFEFIYYRSREPNTPRLNEDLMEELEQMLVFKFNGKPHWGKNRDIAFEGAGAKLERLSKFLEVKKRFDPQGMFSSEWTDAILGIGKPGARSVATVQKHCALEGLCICSEDEHCAPEKKYVCRPGRVYKEARVCRYEPDQSSSE